GDVDVAGRAGAGDRGIDAIVGRKDRRAGAGDGDAARRGRARLGGQDAEAADRGNKGADLAPVEGDGDGAVAGGVRGAAVRGRLTEVAAGVEVDRAGAVDGRGVDGRASSAGDVVRHVDGGRAGGRVADVDGGDAGRAGHGPSRGDSHAVAGAEVEALG